MRILFVCSANIDRSPTAERIYSGRSDFEVKSAGVSEYALTPVSSKLIKWADVILCMEDKHKQKVIKIYSAILMNKIVDSLDVPDIYKYMDNNLVNIIREKTDVWLNNYFSKKYKYIVLFRGINVGGKNIIKMDKLKAVFEELNYSSVKTYIQSGNVIFDDHEIDRKKLKENIGKALLKILGNDLSFAILTYNEIKQIVNEKPEGFGEDKENKYDIIYLMEPLKVKNAIKEIKTRNGVDEIYPGKKVIYISRSIKYLSKSYLSKIMKTSIYSNITIRNWNTTKKIYELMKKNDTLIKGIVYESPDLQRH